MKARTAIAAGLLAAICSGHQASAQEQSANAMGAAQANVVMPLRAVALVDLSFGAILVGQQGGMVTVAPDGASASYSGSLKPSLGCTGDCRPRPAIFDVSGEAERSYRVVLSNAVVATGTNSGINLAIGNLKVRSRNDPSSDNGGQLNAAGNDRFEIGGSLIVPQGTLADVFRADLPVTVSYD